MTTMQVFKVTIGTLWRLGLCALAGMIGIAAGGALLSSLVMPVPEAPVQTDPQIAGLLLFVADFILAAGLIPLARRLQGSYWLRWAILALLCYVCLGVAVPLEGAIFTALHGMASVTVLFIPHCLLFAAVVAALFKPVRLADSVSPTARGFFQNKSPRQWAWRFVAAALVFPAVYWIFGLVVAPFVTPYYEQGQLALALPSAGVVVLTQFVRGLFFLAASVPILMMWSGSRRQLVLALGLAFYMLVGLFGMVQSYWLAPTLQILHNSEILADSMVYTLALALLLARRDETQTVNFSACLPLCTERVSIAK